MWPVLLPPAYGGKVMFSACLSVHSVGGVERVGTPVSGPRSFPQGVRTPVSGPRSFPWREGIPLSCPRSGVRPFLARTRMGQEVPSWVLSQGTSSLPE